MQNANPIPRYGVLAQTTAPDEIARAVESLGALGFAVMDAGYPPDRVAEIRDRFDKMRARNLAEYGADRLRALNEHTTIRCPLARDGLFLELATNERVLELCTRLIGTGYILNQQNPGDEATYNQAFYHRDLPYQHFISSRPLAINALFCIDDFTLENGCTLVVPASHKLEAFPSDDFIRQNEKPVTAPAGSFLLLDCMVYHRGGQNRSGKDRRAANHVYTIGLMRQQIELPALLGPDFAADAKVRRLLGYDYVAPRSPAEYYEGRWRKVQASEQRDAK
jgi:hypothetical protein